MERVDLVDAEGNYQGCMFSNDGKRSWQAYDYRGWLLNSDRADGRFRSQREAREAIDKAFKEKARSTSP